MCSWYVDASVRRLTFLRPEVYIYSCKICLLAIWHLLADKLLADCQIKQSLASTCIYVPSNSQIVSDVSHSL